MKTKRIAHITGRNGRKMPDVTTSISGKPIRIKRTNPNNVAPIHVNDMLVTYDGKEYFITFSEIEPPVVMDEKDLEILKSVDATTKVKLVMSGDFAEAIVKTLTEVLEKNKALRKFTDG